MKFTAEQQKAIETQDKNLLVSASAGTGKTTVMIERIIRLVETKKVSLDEVVVVTFTIAAANQMKEKLRRSLNDKASDPYIYEQLEKLDTCAISTLHSFCSDLLREYFYAADIDPSYSILDSMLSDGLKDKTMDTVFSEYYSTDDEIFGKLTSIFHQKRTDESLKKIVLRIFELSRCVENFFETYEKTRENYLAFGKNNIFEKMINQSIVTHSNAYSTYFELKSRWAKNVGANKLAKYLVEHSSYYQLSEQNDLKNNLERLSESFDIKFTKKTFLAENLSVDPEEAESEIVEIEKTRDKANKWRKEYAELISEYGYEKLVENTKETLPFIDKLIELTKKFEIAYTAEKKEKGALDFSDLERYTLTVLNDEKIQAEIKEKYKYIFVDEYQDINSVQEAIISKLSGERNLFLVGDVKQSIYGFRETNPDIFVDKIAEYVDKNDSVVINLNDNFRSDTRILDYINSVFSAIMTNGFGKVDYLNSALLTGKNQTISAFPPITVETIEINPVVNEIGEKYDISKCEETEDKKLLVADRIAEKITKLIGLNYIINGEMKVIGYGDIAVLCRDMKKESKAIYNALKSRDIPVKAVFDDDLMAKECLDVINFLRVLDNPLNDIYICGTALSFFGGFNQDDLTKIKIYSKQKTFIDNFTKYVAKNNDELSIKALKLLKLIDTYRKYSYSLTVEELMHMLVTDTKFNGQSYLVYVKGLPNGKIRYEKLTNMLFAIKDKSYSVSIDKYLRFLDEGKTSPISAPDFTDSVTLTTIHKSKGLEYPIVVSPNLDKNFYQERGAESSVQIDRDMGLGMKYYDFSNKSIHPTLSHMAIDLKKKRKEKEEKMRLLYVLLTRAKYSLILIENKKGKKPPAAEMGDSFSDWLACGNQICFEQNEKDFKNLAAATVSQNIQQSSDEKFVLESFDYSYPYAAAIQTPLKISASQIREETEAASETDENQYTKWLVKAEDDAALVGTAYHKIFETLTFNENIEQIKQKIDEFVHKGIFSKTVAELISPEKIFDGINNKDLQKILDGEVYHEIPFMLKVPYAELYKQSDVSEKTVLQGVIDMMVLKDGVATIIDFKYTSRPEYIKQNYSAQLNAYAFAAEKI
ncbi:MAG TPA: UvrD-helicase domain-containing protein, partial [Clostridia bacterium]|nr:UvrD-helicase domain-containing protein [Clostridia bacterium]